MQEAGTESTGIHRRSPSGGLEAVGNRATFVNARHDKDVPGRSSDVSHAKGLAPLAKRRESPLIARQRQQLVAQLATEKNRLQEVLTVGRIRLDMVVKRCP